MRDIARLRQKTSGCSGIIHLAAISRVVHAQNDPIKCWETNVRGTSHLLREALSFSKKPWVVFASSREVYGQQNSLPVHEDSGLKPMNVYGCAKVAGEMECMYARSLGLNVSVVRFSNVYGGIEDHEDRVVPAFVRGVISHCTHRIEGADNIFDFTHVEDVVQGLVKLIALMNSKEAEDFLPPIHFVSGRGTTLQELSSIIHTAADSPPITQIVPPRTFDVHAFIGDTKRAQNLLGWKAKIALEDGIKRLLDQLQEIGNENFKNYSRVSNTL